MNESTADSCLFYRIKGCNKLILVLYVDNGLVVATKEAVIEEFLFKLKSELKITSGSVGCFLNIQIIRSSDGSIWINQKKYTENIVNKFNMQDSNAVGIPIERNAVNYEETEQELSVAPYREAVAVSCIYPLLQDRILLLQ